MAKKKQIALLCPGGPISQDLAQKVGEIATARFGDRAGLHFHPQCFDSAGHFAGDDARRSAAFLECANDPAFDAIWFARGGYGACRLNEALFDQLNDAARAKTYFGYSDAGFLLARLYRLGVGRQVHGPMVADFPRDGGEAAIARALGFLVDDDQTGVEPLAVNETSLAFNITVLAHLVGTPWAPDFSGHVVMLEDVSEHLYAIDRAMFAITSDAAFRKAAGVRLGRISDVPENDRPFGQSAEEIVQDWCARAGIAYLGAADIGHDADNKIVPFGGSDPAAA